MVCEKCNGTSFIKGPTIVGGRLMECANCGTNKIVLDKSNE